LRSVGKRNGDEMISLTIERAACEYRATRLH
jgi:hypothetical protein